MATRPPEAAGFGAELALPANIVSGPRPYASGRLIVATRTVRGNPTEGIESSTLRVRFGSLDGVFGSSRVIANRSHSIERPRLVVNRSGDAALAWWEGRGTPPTIYVSLRRRGGSFGAPIKIGQRGVGLTDHSVAIGENGDVLVAWEAAGRIRTRMKLHAERRFRSLDELRSDPATSAGLRTAVAANGRAWVAWGAQRFGDGGPIGDGRVQVARRPAGASRFDPALLLERSFDLPSAPSLAINAAAPSRWPGRPPRRLEHRRRRDRQGRRDPADHGAGPLRGLRGTGAAAAALADGGAATVAWTQFRDATPTATSRCWPRSAAPRARGAGRARLRRPREHADRDLRARRHRADGALRHLPRRDERPGGAGGDVRRPVS